MSELLGMLSGSPFLQVSIVSQNLQDKSCNTITVKYHKADNYTVSSDSRCIKRTQNLYKKPQQMSQLWMANTQKTGELIKHKK